MRHLETHEAPLTYGYHLWGRESDSCLLFESKMTAPCDQGRLGVTVDLGGGAPRLQHPVHIQVQNPACQELHTEAAF